MNQGILSNNDNFIFPKGNNKTYTTISFVGIERPSIRESIKKIGTIEYYSNGIFGLNQGFSSFNNISGVDSIFLSSSTGIIRDNTDSTVAFTNPTRTTGIIPAGASGVNYDNFSSSYGSSIVGYLTTNNYNWNPDKFCIVVDTTKNPGGLYFNTVPCCPRQGEFLIIDWGDDSLLDKGGNFIDFAFPHLYKKHGIYIIQISISAGYFFGSNPFNGGIGGAASEMAKSTNNSVIGILSMGNPPYVDGFKNIFTTFGGKLSNLLFIPNKLPNNINSKTSPIDSFGLSNNIEILTLLFFQRKFVPSDRLDYSSCESWDTSDIKYFFGVFRDSSIQETNLSKWNTSQALNFQQMFEGAIFFRGNGLEYWDTSKCTIFNNMFVNCSVFNNNLSGWNISKATATNNMFDGCASFRGAGLETWNVVTGVTSMSQMFRSCTRLTNITISGWSPASGCNHNQQFISANISGSYLPNWTFAPNSNCASMFQGCNLTNVSGFESWNTSGITNMSSMFNSSINFNSNLSGWNVSSATNFSFMFIGCANFTGSGLENWNVSNVTSVSNMFSFCPSFNTNLSGWNVSKTANFNELFRGCSNFIGSGLENWNVSNVTNFINSFGNCSRLGSGFNLDLSNWNVSSGTNFSNMFIDCSNFTGSGLENWNVSNATTTSEMFRGCRLFNANLSGWNVSKISNLNTMFFGCTNFRGSGLENWNVSNNTNFGLMFFFSTNFNNNLSGWNVSSGTTFNSMFQGCTNFRGSGLENWNLARINTANGLDNFLANTTGISTSQYDLILNSWNNNKSSAVNGVANWRTDLKPHFGSSKYTVAGSGARAALVSYGWTITDGGLQT